MKNHYDKTYYAWQKKAGEYAATQDLFKYTDYIKQTDVVLDFGCGGGYILEKLNCKKKYGVEINPIAKKEAEKRGIIMYTSLKDIPKYVKFDVIISHHTLEHLEYPASTLKQLKNYMKKDGIAIHVVPIDDWRTQKTYTEKDINKHMFTWTPLLLGNLFVHCGYTIKEIKIITHHWLPFSRFYYTNIPKFVYYFFTKIWSTILLNRQMRIVVTRT